jgi:hypothetical protein
VTEEADIGGISCDPTTGLDNICGSLHNRSRQLLTAVMSMDAQAEAIAGIQINTAGQLNRGQAGRSSASLGVPKARGLPRQPPEIYKILAKSLENFAMSFSYSTASKGGYQ